MNIDLHILVNIIQLIVIGVGGLYFVWTVKAKLDLLIQETSLKHITNLERFVEIDKKLNDLVGTTIELARQSIRMDHIDNRMQELSNRVNNGVKKVISRSKG